MCIFMISKIYTLNAYRSCWKVYPFFFPNFGNFDTLSTVRAYIARPWKTTLFTRFFLYEHGVHLSMAVAPPPPPGVLPCLFPCLGMLRTMSKWRGQKFIFEGAKRDLAKKSCLKLRTQDMSPTPITPSFCLMYI